VSFAGAVMDEALERKWELLEEGRQRAISAMPVKCRRTTVTEAQESQSMLHEVRVTAEGVGVEYAQAMGSYSWLFYLRRTPLADVLEGNLPTTAPYRLALAEQLSSMTSHAEYYPADSMRRVVPPLDRQSAEALFKLCGVATFLQGIHASIRRAGKGQRISWDTVGEPSSVPDARIEPAISLYDSRVAAGKGQGAKSGLTDFCPVFLRLDRPIAFSELILSVMYFEKQRMVPYWEGPLAKARPSLRPGRFLVGGSTFAGVKDMVALATSISSWAQPGLASLITFLRLMFKIVYTSDIPFGSLLPSVGYFTLPKSLLLELIEDELPLALVDLQPLGFDALPANATEVFADLNGMNASLWPVLPGPILREAGEQTAVDIFAATQRLRYLLTVLNDAPIDMVRARAGHFELVVQDLIDASPWRPPDVLRDLRGRTLRFSSNMITDIDAIASKKNVVILVSCKSMPYTPDLDAGVYNKVRNLRTNLEEYDADWVAKTNFICRNPRGDNYNLPGYDIYGVVCVPFVPFTALDQARKIMTTETASLPAVCSVEELHRFLCA
jgi:hypothetical protein